MTKNLKLILLCFFLASCSRFYSERASDETEARTIAQGLLTSYCSKNSFDCSSLTKSYALYDKGGWFIMYIDQGLANGIYFYVPEVDAIIDRFKYDPTPFGSFNREKKP